MKRIILLSFLFLGGCGITVPYFDKLSPDEVCGGFSSDCQSVSSKYWAKVNPGVDYDGKVGNALGRKFVNVFDDSPCVANQPMDEDINITGRHELKGSLSKNSLNEFKINLEVDLVNFIKQYMKDIPNDLDAEITSQVSLKTDIITQNKIDLEYYRISLKKEFTDSDNFQTCMSSLQEKEKVVTGISVIKVSGEWSKETISNVFANIEASVGYNNLTADAKNKYNRDKSKVLEGKFEPITYYFTVTYRLSPKA
jgi:hypothetical protein